MGARATAGASMALDFDALALDQPTLTASGTPLLLPIEAIDEDPAQPRLEFDAEALQQLADTIAQRGVRQPVSVRTHPGLPGRWMLNFGARRLRASHLAGKTAIPAFVDEAADSYDQVIENEQREGLKPLELALFVQRRMASGDRQAEIARSLGKSRAYITFVSALIDAPDWLIALYRSGKCRGIAELYELRKLHASQPHAVETWVDGRGSVSRADTQALKDHLAASRPNSEPITARPVAPTTAGTSAAVTTPRPTPDVNALLRPVLRAVHQGREVEIVLDAIPKLDGRVLIADRSDARQMEVDAAEVQLVGMVAR